LMVAAAENGNPDVLTTLIEAGADVNARDIDGWTPLIMAAKNWRNPTGMITALLNAGADAKVKDKAGKMAINYAKENERLSDTDALRALQNASY
jgi:ankyrin repeat protein